MRKLKYKWFAFHSDGSFQEGNDTDVSSNDPTKSAYYDINHDTLIGFSLKDEINEYFVDLVDGHFDINMVPFKLHEEPLTEPLRLIYFHRNQHDICLSPDNPPEATAHRREFHIGWQTTVDGINIQKTIRFD